MRGRGGASVRLRSRLGGRTAVQGPAAIIYGKQEDTLDFPEALRALNILDSVSDAVLAFDREWRYTYSNAAADAMARVPRGKLVGERLWDLFPDLSGTPVQAALQRAMDERVSARLEFYYAPFDLWTEIDGHPTVDGAVVFVRDITQRKRAEAERDEQKALLRMVIDGMPGLVSYLDRDYRYRFVNAGYAAWFNRTGDDFTGKTIPEVLGPESLEMIRPQLERAFAGETVTFERRFDYPDTGREIRATYVPQPGPGGRIEGIVVLVQDITEQKRAEEALQASEAQFRRIVEIAAEGIWMIDQEARTTFVNQRMADMLGYTPAEMMGRVCIDFIHPADQDRGRRGIEGRLQGDARPREYRAVRKDGSVIWLDFTASRIQDGDGQPSGLLAMCTDITERRHAQEQLQQTQKLESLGVLAGGIAHDFNNLLVGILGNASLAQDTLEPGLPAHSMLRDVIGAGERAAQLTRQMLAYAGHTERTTAAVDLNALVTALTPLLHASIPKTVNLRLALEDRMPAVEADEGQLQQVLMNLVINGAEAIPTGETGAVTITTTSRTATASERRRAVIPMADAESAYVVLCVTDSGSGMDPVTIARIFDPFFTTKFAGRGLGLSAVLGIIKAHGGTLTIDSRCGEGTTFCVFLPAARRAAAPPPAAAGGRTEKATGTVLVVDDEEPVRTVACRALRHAGYTVLTARDGLEAIESVRANPTIDAVVLDLAMPSMTGDQAAPRLRELRPDLRILLSSGYAEKEAVGRFGMREVDGFLQKPYTAGALTEKLRQLLK